MYAERPATERQLALVRDLLRELRGEDNYTEAMDTMREDGVFEDVRATSRAIDSLIAERKARPRTRPVVAPQPPPDAEGIPAARYALAGPGGWEFFLIDKPEKGKWAGRVFVKRLRGNPGNFAKYPVARADIPAIFDRIRNAVYWDGTRELHGPQAAAVAFSREHGVCAACLAKLTDMESIAEGLGPICRTRFQGN